MAAEALRGVRAVSADELPAADDQALANVLGMVASQLGEVRDVPLRQIKPYPANARKIPAKAVDRVAASIAEFGWQQPIVTDADMVVIIGHVRLKAAHKLGLATAPVKVDVTLTPGQVRALRIMDNRSHDYTTWDYSVLAAELGELAEDFGEVLDLADWQGLIEQFQAAEQESGSGLYLNDPEAAAVLKAEFAVTVTFARREDCERAGLLIFDTIPGVVNVRYPPQFAHGDLARDHHGGPPGAGPAENGAAAAGPG